MEPVTRETVGQRIRRLRRAKGLSQRQLAGPKGGGVGYAYIARIEKGERNPSVPALRYLAGKLGVDPEYLESGEAIPAAKERELRLVDAEIGLRMGGDLGAIEESLRAMLEEGIPDGLEVRIRATLGTLLARTGQNEEAREQLERVVASGGVRPETRGDVYEILATVYVATRRSPQAIELLERAIATVDKDERHLTQRVRFRSFLAQTFSSVGALDRASSVLEEAMVLAEDFPRPADRVGLYWAGARLAWMEAQDADTALRYAGRAIGLLEATEDTMELARAHLLAGQICNLDGRPEEANWHFEQAEPTLKFGEDPAFGALRAEQAKVEAKLGDPARAVDLAREAMMLVLEDVRFLPNATHALALALTAAGDIDAADEQYRRAVALLGERFQWREAIQVSRDWANALREAERERDALAVLDSAMEFDRRDAAARATRRPS
jgi:transcriptional regulator with XRE-family HTH domain